MEEVKIDIKFIVIPKKCPALKEKKRETEQNSKLM
jgi:hypothetical protein